MSQNTRRPLSATRKIRCVIVGRVITTRCFAASCTHLWWPRRNVEAPAPRQSQHTNGQLLESQRRIYILGVGNVGSFVAHSLAGIPNRPPITLLFRTQGHVRRWEEHNRCLKVVTHGVPEMRWGFDVEAIQNTQANATTQSNGEPNSDLALSTANGVHDFALTAPQVVTNSQYENDPWKIEPSTTSKPQYLSGIVDGELSRLKASDSTASEATFTASQRPKDSSDLNQDGAGTRTSFSASDSSRTEGEVPDKSMTESTMDESIIHNLIVTVKAPHTVTALQAWAHRLTADSTILFLQNGMGIIDEVNEKVFPDEAIRPNYLIGVFSHGLWSSGDFEVVRAGQGTISLGMTPHSTTRGSHIVVRHLNDTPPSSRYLMRTMTRTPVFVAVGFAPTDLLQQQLDKLAINAIINPLTAVLDCNNGALLSNFHFTRVMRLLLAEISLVVQSLPEMQNVPNVVTRFDTARLERLVVSIASVTAQNRSSMLQDVRNARLTEIDYITGYIVTRGEEQGIQCVMNYMLMHIVKGKSNMVSHEKQDMIPLQRGLRRQQH